MERIAGQEKLVLFSVLGPCEDRMSVPADRRFQQIGVERLTGLQIVLSPGERRLPIPMLQLLIVDRRRRDAMLIDAWFQPLRRFDETVACLERPIVARIPRDAPGCGIQSQGIEIPAFLAGLAAVEDPALEFPTAIPKAT